ncbi:MAG: hypothetical protein E3J72_13975 [Planctomycetota bacterium]|nr:MAG: hypothetical protein E3J72_13975 [Planctomycetota bacterium]
MKKNSTVTDDKTASAQSESIPARRTRHFHKTAAIGFWAVGCAAGAALAISTIDGLGAIWKLGYASPVLSISALILFAITGISVVAAVSILAYRMPEIIAGWVLAGRAIRLKPAWISYAPIFMPGIAAALTLYGVIAFLPLLSVKALLYGWWVPAIATVVLIAVGLLFFIPWRHKVIPTRMFLPPSSSAVERLTRLSPNAAPLPRLEEIGTPLLWYLMGCTPVARDASRIVWACTKGLDPGVIPIISHCTTSNPRFIIVPDDLEQRNATEEAAKRYDLWPRFRIPGFAFHSGCRMEYAVKFHGDIPSPGVPEGRVLVVGLRVFHRLRDVRNLFPDAVFGTHSTDKSFAGFGGVSTDETFLEVHSRQGKPPSPPPVFGIIQFRQEGRQHSSGFRTFLELPGPLNYTGVSIDGVDGSGALLIRLGDQLHRVAPGITAPQLFEWHGYLMLRGHRYEEMIRCWVQGFFLLPKEMVRWKLDLPDEPAEPSPGFTLLHEFFKFPDFSTLK